MIRLLYNKSEELFSRIIKNSCVENSVNACKICGVYKNLVKNRTSWN